MASPRFLPFGDAAILVEYGEVVDRDIGEQVIALDGRVASANIPGVIETAPSFRSLMVQFDPLVSDAEAVEAGIRKLLGEKPSKPKAGKSWRIPACYEGEFGADLEDVAEKTGVSPKEIVKLHSGTEHHVYMIGFLPGCPYLGDLPREIDLPRRRDPRTHVPPGGVAIAVGLTVLYPVESPGGWNLIGRIPVPLFSPFWERPALLSPGDKVRLEPVKRSEYDRIAKAVEAGDWNAERELAA